VEDETTSGRFKRLVSLLKGSSSEPVKLELGGTSPKPKQTAAAVQGERVPGNYYVVEFLIKVPLRNTVQFGFPKVAIRNITSGQKSWGSKIDLCWPNPEKPHVDWIDDPEHGFGARTIERPEDALGAEGIIGGNPYRFERILDIGKNQVVYALYNPVNQTRLAFGFDRGSFELGYVK
jgi:hypothetical protein